MTDEEFLSLKNQIRQVCFMCHEINSTFLDLKEEISELGKCITNFECDVNKLKSDVNSLEVI